MIIVVSLVAVMIMGLVFQTNYVKRSHYLLSHGSNMKFNVVQLSDLHGQTRFMNGSLSRMVNKLKPDYVMITGDLASKKKHLGRVLDELKKIKCPNIYLVPGNYEREEVYKSRKRLFSTEEYELMIQAFQNQGITVLENRGVTVEIDGKQLLIYGFDNSFYGNERANISHEDLAKHDYVVFLAHSPSIINLIEAIQTPFDLLLVGHTHGGQIRLFGRTIGAYKDCHVGMKLLPGNQSFYINRGLGTVKIPIRFACPPEIAIFHIGESRNQNI